MQYIRKEEEKEEDSKSSPNWNKGQVLEIQDIRNRLRFVTSRELGV